MGVRVETDHISLLAVDWPEDKEKTAEHYFHFLLYSFPDKIWHNQPISGAQFPQGYEFCLNDPKGLI